MSTNPKKWTGQKSQLLETKEGRKGQGLVEVTVPGPRRDPEREVARRSKTYTLEWFVNLPSGSRAGQRPEVSPLVTARLWDLVRIPSEKSGGWSS